jgi:hypothetical protein
MATERSNDPRAFRDFLDAKLSNGGEGQSLDELLALWEYENAPEEEREETIRAIQRGLDDMHAGRTTDAFEFVDRMRQKIQATAKR